METRAERLFPFVAQADEGFVSFLESENVSVLALVGEQLYSLGRDESGDFSSQHQFMPQCRAMMHDEQGLWLAQGAFLWSYQPPRSESGSEWLSQTFFPQFAMTLGDLGVCDLISTKGLPLVVSAIFDCIGSVDEHFSLVPLWSPLATGSLGIDRGPALSGAVVDGEELWVTALGREPLPKGSLLNGDGEVLVGDLNAPFAPRILGDRLVLAEAGTGRILSVDRESRAVEVVMEADGVLNALGVAGNHLLIGYGSPTHAWFPGRGKTLPGHHYDSEAIAVLKEGSRIGTVFFEGHSGPVRQIVVIPSSRLPSITPPQSYLAHETVILPSPQ
jgi:uncharacterized protein (TIGR03032 family)